jgi:hypothetical protein
MELTQGKLRKGLEKLSRSFFVGVRGSVFVQAQAVALQRISAPQSFFRMNFNRLEK